MRVLIALVALLALPPAAHARDNHPQCRVDIKKFCGGRVNGIGASCLKNNLEKLAPECRAIVIAGEK
jgi:hypothetical protein